MSLMAEADAKATVQFAILDALAQDAHITGLKPDQGMRVVNRVMTALSETRFRESTKDWLETAVPER